MEEKIKQTRNELLSKLVDNEITFYDWDRIKAYIDDKYMQLKLERTL